MINRRTILKTALTCVPLSIMGMSTGDGWCGSGWMEEKCSDFGWNPLDLPNPTKFEIYLLGEKSVITFQHEGNEPNLAAMRERKAPMTVCDLIEVLELWPTHMVIREKTSEDVRMWSPVTH